MKLKPGSGAFYVIQPENGPGLFSSYWGPHGADKVTTSKTVDTYSSRIM